MARPTALAPLGAVFRSIGSTLEGIGAGTADTSSREKRVLPSRAGKPVSLLWTKGNTSSIPFN